MKRIVFAAFALFGCSSQEKKPTDINSNFEPGIPLGKVEERLEEASGLVASAANPGMLWTHNDSGHPAEVFLIDSLAQIRMVCKLKGVDSRDWEDIAMGPGPDSTKNYLYVGDIGDNDAKYPVKIIYRFEEPVLTTSDIEITEFDTLFIKLDDGVRDAEALMIDPLNKGMYLLSKREDSVHFYKIDYPFLADTLTARFRVKLPFHKINAAEISPDGTEVVIKDYQNIYYWQRKDAGPISKLLQTPATILPYQREQQGESITFHRKGLGFYTLSESPDKPAELMFYKRK